MHLRLTLLLASVLSLFATAAFSRVFTLKNLVAFNYAINGDQPALIMFEAVWCGECRTMKPILDKLSESLSDKVGVYQVDINMDELPYGVGTLPTFVLFINGTVGTYKTGLHSHETLMEWIKTEIPNY